VKHNSYFEGKVQSLGLNEREGFATVGVVEPGDYTFSTDKEERMSVVAGSLRLQLPGAAWKDYGAGSVFIVPPKTSFKIVAEADAAYICRYR
jgi:purine/pyrimidine-nucleoside phosphorylase